GETDPSMIGMDGTAGRQLERQDLRVHDPTRHADASVAPCFERSGLDRTEPVVASTCGCRGIETAACALVGHLGTLPWRCARPEWVDWHPGGRDLQVFRVRF